MNKAAAETAAQVLARELKRRNLPATKLPLLMHQLAVETAGFTSGLVSDNNLSGIKFFGQKQATQGRPVPKSEFVKGAKFGNYYAKYDTLQQWAEDYINVLQKHGHSLDASSLEDFAARLKNAGYFQAKLEDYIKALKSWSATFSKYLPSIKLNGANISIIAIIAIVVIFFLISKN